MINIKESSCWIRWVETRWQLCSWLHTNMGALCIQMRHCCFWLLIVDQAAFDNSVVDASALARLDKLVTFGIVSIVSETGFGSIEAGNAFGEG